MALYTKPAMLNIIWASGGDRVAPDAVKYALGWLQEIPPRQYFNALDYKQDAFIAYINQMGIPEWDLETEYHAGKSIVQGSDGVIYQCVVTGTNINPVVDQSNRWRKIAIEEAPRDGKQYVRRNNSWQQIDSTAFAPAVHSHSMDQVNGLANALNNKVDKTGATPILNSVTSIELRLVSQANQINILRGVSGTTNSWYIGKGSATSDDVMVDNTVSGTRMTLKGDRVEFNKPVYVGTNAVWTEGTLNPSDFAKATHSHPVGQITGDWPYNRLSGVPSNFTPAPHTQNIDTINDLQNQLNRRLRNDSSNPQITAPHASLHLVSNSGNHVYVHGSRGGTAQWWVGMDGSSTELRLNNSVLGTTLACRSGDVYANKTIATAGNLSAYSDARLKTVKGGLSSQWNTVKSLPKGFYYTWNEKSPNQDKETLQLGLSAQEIQKVYPEVVSEGSDGTLSLDYSRLVVVLLDVVQELQQRVEALESKE